MKNQKTPYSLGKLPAEHLAHLLSHIPQNNPRLIMGGQVGQDAAVIDIGERYLVAKTDPITFATDQIGWYAVQVNANDIACTGATPLWFLATLLLPEGKTTPALVDQLFSQITTACADLNITLVGGHTEITYGLDRPIVIGQMLGEVDKDKLVLTQNAQPSDDLILTKQIAVEATAIMATEKRDQLLKIYDDQTLDRLANYLHEPSISVLPEAQIVMQVGGVHAMHDPTEGGVATGLHELAEAAQAGLEIFADTLPFDPACQALCQHFGLNPLGVIASGSLLLAIAPSHTSQLIQRLNEATIRATVIGRVQPASFGIQFVSGERLTPLPRFEQDEITHLFAS